MNTDKTISSKELKNKIAALNSTQSRIALLLVSAKTEDYQSGFKELCEAVDVAEHWFQDEMVPFSQTPNSPQEETK